MSPSVSLWANKGHYVDAEAYDDGHLEIRGQILGGGDDEYEYALTVGATDIGKIVSALGGEAGAAVLPLLSANAEMIVGMGERTWLRKIGIEPELWNRLDPHGSWP